MTLRFPWWAYGGLGAILLLLGWCGHSLTTKSASPELLAKDDSLRATRDDVARERAQRRAFEDSLLLVNELRRTESEQALREAARLRASGQAARIAAQGLDQALGLAQNAADSVPLLVAKTSALSLALDTIMAANDTLTLESVRLTADKARLLLVIDTLRVQRSADSLRLTVQDKVLDGFRKAATPCQHWCPTLVGNYEIREKAVSVGAGFRPRSWLTLSATYQVH